MKRLLKYTFILFFVSTSLILLSSKVKAQPAFTYPKYNVDIKINKDSTFDVTESVDYQLYGTVHQLFRDLTLEDPTRDCSTYTCGGFDRIQVLKVTDNQGNDLKGHYTLSEVDEDSGKRSMELAWNIAPNGRNFNGETVGWIIQYKIFGGIQKVGDNPYFYWNILPEDRGGTVQNSNMKITFPDGVAINKDNFQIYADYTPDISVSGNQINLSTSNLSTFGYFTVSYKFNNSDIDLPGNIQYVVNSPQLGVDVYLDGELLDGTSNNYTIKSVPAGTHAISFRHVGYNSWDQTIIVKSGETQRLNLSLQPRPFMSFLLMANIILFLSILCFIPLGIVFVYLHYRANGRDQEMPQTIIPLFSPPDNVHPYLAGALNNEEVNKVDVVGTIIDLAYRGYIKIQEIKANQNYELTRLSGKAGDPGLDDVENKVMDALFGFGTVIETKNLKYSFPYKYPNIVNRITRLLVERGYFVRPPQTTIGIYVGIGLLILIFGGLTTFCISGLASAYLGYFSLFSPGIFLCIVGLGFLVIAKFMPSKTPVGSKTYTDILGFRMYLYTAERYRLQNLGPEEFEKYLSYAIIFKIEKEWAKKFEGIYNKVPDWYVGTHPNVYDAFWISAFVTGFTNSTISNITPIRSSSASGGGWSGGGSFGGFAGGGGGGGSSGAR